MNSHKAASNAMCDQLSFAAECRIELRNLKGHLITQMVMKHPSREFLQY